MNSIFKGLFSVSALLASLLAFSQNNNKEIITTGPRNGTLIIVGGGQTDSCLKYFIELAGGTHAPIVVVPTAAGVETHSEFYVDYGKLLKLGADNVTILHTNDREVANSDQFTSPLKSAKGVWFRGGRQWHLVDSYKGTRTEKLFWEVLDRGGVIGGTSAGASIQGSYLARGDTRNNQIMMGDHEEGFGFVKNIAIDQHHLARNRHFDMFDILKNRPELLGIGIDESTAAVVRGDIFEVKGPGYIAVYDGSFWSREGSELKNLPPKDRIFFFLRQGERYNIRERKVINRK